MRVVPLPEATRTILAVYNDLDATVPVSHVPDMIRHIRRIADRYRLRIGILAHAGDGNMHPLISTDTRDKEEWKRVEAANREIFELAMTYHGTLSGEHGIGLAKNDYLPASDRMQQKFQCCLMCGSCTNMCPGGEQQYILFMRMRQEMSELRGRSKEVRVAGAILPRENRLRLASKAARLGTGSLAQRIIGRMRIGNIPPKTGMLRPAAFFPRRYHAGRRYDFIQH